MVTDGLLTFSDWLPAAGSEGRPRQWCCPPAQPCGPNAAWHVLMTLEPGPHVRLSESQVGMISCNKQIHGNRQTGTLE